MKQKDALKILKAGKNVYLTGAAGSGKTYALNEYITYLKNRGVRAGITASTGISRHAHRRSNNSFVVRRRHQR